MTRIQRQPLQGSLPSRPYVWRGDPALSIANEDARAMATQRPRRYNGKTVQEWGTEWGLTRSGARSRLKALGIEPDQ